jgi:putative lipoprotein
VIEGNARYAGHGLGRWPGSMRLLLWVGLVAWAAGCAPGSSGSSGAGVVSGSVTYGERMALPPDAVVEVTLSDVSVQDAAASIIAQATVVAAGREVPLPFELRYDPKKIHPTGWYAMRAAIRREGRLIFTSDTVYRVITHGNPTQVDLHLVRVGDGADSRSGGAARVEAIRADLASYRAVQGTGAAGDDGAAWIAYFDGAALRRIDETSGQGHDGTAENEYYFESGKLVAYVSRETRAVTDPGRRERSGSRSASPSIRPGPKRSSRRPWTADPPPSTAARSPPSAPGRRFWPPRPPEQQPNLRHLRRVAGPPKIRPPDLLRGRDRVGRRSHPALGCPSSRVFSEPRAGGLPGSPADTDAPGHADPLDVGGPGPI